MDGLTSMTGFGLAHWVIFAAGAIVFIYPAGRILRRLGLSPLWVLVAFAPGFNLFGLWMLAFAVWPLEERRQEGRN